MSDAIGIRYPGGSTYYTGAAEVDPYAAYTNDALVWNNELALGQLDAAGISQRVWASANNQNVYFESLNQRMKAMEDDQPSDEDAYEFQKLALEISAVKGATQGQPWLETFNNVLQDYHDRAVRGYDFHYNGSVTPT